MHSILNYSASFLLSQSLQISTVFLLVSVLCVLLRKANAHWRYLLWLVVVAKCVTPPIVGLPLAVLPPETTMQGTPSIAFETEPKDESRKLGLEQSAKQRAEREILREPVSTSAQAIVPLRLSPKPSFHWEQMYAFAWLTVLAVLLWIIAYKMWMTHHEIRRRRIPADLESQTTTSLIAESLGLRKVPKVYEVSSTVQPFVWGWLRGDIYLPSQFSETGSADERRAILTHELAHVMRWDVGVNHLQNIVQAIFFFHPLIWIANRRLRLEREKCCDEMVLAGASTSPKVYCEAIVDMLTRECASKAATPGLAVTGATKNIKERITTMLTPNRIFVPRPTRATIVALVIFAICVLPTALVLTSQKGTGLLWGQDGSKSTVESKRFRWKLVDEAGKPIQGALVIGAGMRCIETPSAGFGWPQDGSIQSEFVTDDNGEAEMDYPVRWGIPGHWLTTSQISARFKHPDFVTGYAEVNPALGNANQVLIKGNRTAIRCTDMNGAPMNEFAVLMAGKGDDVIWKLENGEAHSSGVPEGSFQTMLVVPGLDGKHQFSDPFEVDTSKGEGLVNQIEVHPGMRLIGSLSDNVPRPIVNGTVIAFCIPKPLGPSMAVNPSVTWTHGTEIAADGTFEFASLPPGKSVQLVALCNGWLIEGWENNLLKGAVLSINDAEIEEKLVSGVTLQMEQAGQIEVEVVGPDGKPLAGTEVSSWPNQCYSHNSGCTLLGFCYDSIKVAEAQIAGKSPPAARLNEPGRYTQKTNERGIALLQDLPVGKNLGLNVYHENLTTIPDGPKTTDPFAETIAYKCDSPELKKMRVEMHQIRGAVGKKVKNKKMPAGLEKSSSDDQLGSTMNKDDSKFDVELLTTEQLMKLSEARIISLESNVKKSILDYAENLDSIPKEIASPLQLLREGKESLYLKDLAQIILDPNARSVSAGLVQHEDPVVRFLARLAMVSNGDTTSIPDLHKIIHDTQLSKGDRRIICNWSAGVGIRPTDTPKDIEEHFANVTGSEPKFSAGDMAPDFEFETVAGLKFSSNDLRGKAIVLHFWATSCGPCMARMESHIKSLSNYDSRKLEVVFISLDDEKEKFIEAVKRFNIPFKNVRDERGWGGELARTFGVRSMPFDIVIDADGTIISNSIEAIPELLSSTAQ